MSKSQFSDEYKHLCKLLIDSRKEAGMSQKKVAELLGKPQSYVSKYENGERRLDVVELIDIAKALNTEASIWIKILEADN